MVSVQHDDHLGPEPGKRVAGRPDPEAGVEDRLGRTKSEPLEFGDGRGQEHVHPRRKASLPSDRLDDPRMSSARTSGPSRR